MTRLLSDVFRVMFNLDLAQSDISNFDEKESVSAYVMLEHQKATACVTLRILRATAQIIAERAGVDLSSAVSSFVIQDVACEIVNIIANNLRTFLSDKTGIYYEMGRIVPGKADIDVLHPNIVFNLDFQINPDALVKLGFVCERAGDKEAAGYGL